MSPFSTLLRYGYLFHDAPLCLLFPRCCAIYLTTFSTLLRYVYLFHDAPICPLFPHCFAMTTFKRCFAVSSLFTLLCYDNLFHDAPLCLLFSTLRYDYFFNITVLCLPYSRCCAMTTISVMLHFVTFFHAAVL